MRLPIAVLVLAGACIRPTPAPIPGEWVTSDSSQYSPVARFRAHAEIASSELRIAMDSGSLYLPGDMLPDSPPLMSELYLTAILAVPDSGTISVVTAETRRRPADRRGWRPLASSDSILLMKELRYGERAPFPAARLTVPYGALPDGPAWLIYRITGNTVELRAPGEPGGTVRRREIPGGVRVYACAERDVRGAEDPTRAASLKRAYGIAC